MNDYIKDITQTSEGYKVKDLRWLPLDNIIVGLVQDPIWANPNLHDGYVACKWRKNGSCLKEKNRPDLKLPIQF